MLRDLLRTSMILLTLVLLAVTGFVSMTHTTPDRDEAARSALLSVYGVSIADLCLSGGDETARHCPLCHKLPEGIRLSFEGPGHRLAWTVPQTDTDDLVSGTGQPSYQDAPRAPPRII